MDPRAGAKEVESLNCCPVYKNDDIRDAEGGRILRRSLAKRRGPEVPFVGSDEWIGCCEACVALRAEAGKAELRAAEAWRALEQAARAVAADAGPAP